jgi:predicted HNH restriction endonuclease
LIGRFGETSELMGLDNEEIKNFLELLKDELLKENNDLRLKLELSMEEVDRLKGSNLDSSEKEEQIATLLTKIDKLEKGKNTNQYETEFARIYAENVNLKSNQIYYVNVVREILKVVRKQTNQLRSALGLLADQDAKEIAAILKDNKISF